MTLNFVGGAGGVDWYWMAPVNPAAVHIVAICVVVHFVAVPGLKSGVRHVGAGALTVI
jgi:hypothetical protein